MTNQIFDPSRLPFAFEEALNAGDVDAVQALFHPDATMRTVTGDVVTGAEQLREETVRTVALKARLTNTHKHTFIGGDTALLILDWTLEATLPDGTRISPAGSTAAVALRSADSSWLFTVLNPLGTQ